MALSRLDFKMILEAIDGNIAHIKETSTIDDPTFVVKMEIWKHFRDKMQKMWDETEERMQQYERERGV